MSSEYEEYKKKIDAGEYIVGMTQQYLTYNPGAQEFPIIGESNDHYVIEMGNKMPSAIEKKNCLHNEDKTKLVIFSGIVR